MSNVLTKKQDAFVNAYFLSGNVTDAAQQAGYQGSRHILQSIGSQNLSKLIITNALSDLKASKALRSNRSLDDMDAMLWGIMDDKDAADRDKIGAATLEARLNGWLIEKSQHMTGSPAEYAEAQALRAKYDAMSVEELVALRAERRAIAGPQDGRTATEE